METNFENYYKEDFKKKLEDKCPTFTYRNIHWSLFQEVLDELGYYQMEYDPNGWEHDVRLKVWKPKSNYFYNVTCSWYYPETTFELNDDFETLKCFNNEI